MSLLVLLAIVLAIDVCKGYSQHSSNTPSSSALRGSYLAESLPDDHDLTNESNECPTWMHHTSDSGECVCGVSNFHIVKCDQSAGKVYVLGSYKMTYDEEHQEVVVGASVYGLKFSDDDPYNIYHEVPTNKSKLNEAMCGQFNRKGRLCGECKEGYSPLVYSYKIICRNCSEEESKQNILKFTMVALVPLTAFYVIVIVFKFNANSPKLHGFILYAQLVSSPFVIRIALTYATYNMTIGIQVLATLYGIWNLDFFRTLYPDICMRLTTLQVISLDYIIAVYPLLLMLSTLVLFKLHSCGCKIVLCVCYPFHKCLSLIKKDWSEKASMIDVFATFLLLAYGRVMSVNISLLVYTSVVNSRGEFGGRYLYYDSSYEFFGKDHLPYGVFALFMLITVNVCPLLLLFFYPMKWFQRCLNRLRLSHLALHTFVDSFAGCYKDGTEPGTQDCRYFAGLSMFIRISGYIIYEAVHTAVFHGMFGTVTTLILLLYVVFQPYKSTYAIYNKVTVAMIAAIVVVIFATVNVCFAYDKMYRAVTFSVVLLEVSITVPLLYIIYIAIKWTGLCKCTKLLRSLGLKRSRSSSEVAALIERNGENIQPLFDTMLPYH